MVSQWSLRGGKLTGMASLIIADGEAPSPERDEFIIKWMDKISEDRRFDSFNSIRVFINNTEVHTTRIFEAGLHRGLSIVADSIDTEYFQDAKAYPQYIQDLYDKGVRVFCVDDVNRYTKEQVAAISYPIYNEIYKGKARKRRDSYLLLSAAVGTTQSYLEMSRTLSTERIGIEPQMYRSGESTIWVARWFKAYPGITMPALEAYKPDKRTMTSLVDLKTMGNYFVANKPDNMSVYGIDLNTDYDDYPDHWDEILGIIDRWRVARTV
jgi:hypothetical protein